MPAPIDPGAALALTTSGDWSARASVVAAWDALPIARPRPARVPVDRRLAREYAGILARMRADAAR